MPPRTWVPVSWVCLGLLACGRTGDELPAPNPALVQRLELRTRGAHSGASGAQVGALGSESKAPASGSSSAPDLVRAVYLPSADEPAWETYADQSELSRVRSEGGGALVQMMTGRGARGVTLRAPFRAQEFNRVRVQVYCSERSHLSLRCRSGVKQIGEGSSQRVPRRNHLETLEFDLPQPTAADEPIDTLNVVLSSQVVGECGIARIELLERPLVGGILPDTSAGPRLASIGNQDRSAYVLTNRTPLAAHFRVTPGAELRFGHGAPVSLLRPWAGARVQLRLRSDDGRERIEEFALAETPRWQAASVALADFAGRTLEAEFQLLVEQTRETAVLLSTPTVSAAVEGAPCVVLITSDTHRADFLGASHSGVSGKTPFLDRLAAEGTLFEDCFSPANCTGPSHSALMTAMHPRDTGVLQNGIPLASRAETLAERFQAAGWVTHAIVSATHLRHSLSGLGQGFDRIAAPDGPECIAEVSTALAERWQEEVGARPYFLWLHLFDAHGPYEPPEAFRELAARELAGAAGRPTRRLPEQDPQWREAMYRGEIRYLDSELERLLSLPRFRSAIVALTADHGEVLQRDGQPVFSHQALALDTLRIPLLLHGPGVPAGLRVARAVMHMDLGRTLLDLAGLQSARFPGHDLLSSAAEPAPRFGLQSHAQGASLQFGRWFLQMELPTASALARGETHRLLLYDLVADRAGEHDLSRADEETCARLRRVLIDWLLASPGASLTDQREVTDEDAIAQLQALGYADAGSSSPESRLFDAECECASCLHYRELGAR